MLRHVRPLRSRALLIAGLATLAAGQAAPALGSADVGVVSVTAVPAAPHPGDRIDFTFVARNAGPDVASGVRLAGDVGDALFSTFSADCTGFYLGSCTATLAPGGTLTLTIHGQAVNPGTARVTGTAGYASDPAPADNSRSISVTVDGAAAPSQPAGAVRSVSVRPSAFRAGGAGARIVFALTDSASTGFRVRRVMSGRRARGSRCAVATRSNRSRPACTRRVSLPGGLRIAGEGGSNSFVFRGRLGGHRLQPGRYELTASTADPAGVVTARRASFRITG